MKNWNDYWTCLKTYLSLFTYLLVLSICSHSQSLNASLQTSADLQPNYQYANPQFQGLNASGDTVSTNPAHNLPSPKSVLFKSMIIPGWGQVTNRQIWKVPIVYGLLGGLTWYSISLTKKYHDYRAAYYNLNEETPDDQRFGPTPGYIPENANLRELKSVRNKYRNNRDLVYVGVALAYGLNIVDAYVFAHMRSFDVSKDLSMRPSIQPSVMAHNSPGVTFSIDLITK